MAKKLLKERLREKKDELKSRGELGSIIFVKDGETRRIRILPTGEENDFIIEVDQFYLGSDIKGVISPATFNEPCAIMEAYEELKNSEDDDDKELASKFFPRKRYLAYCAFYKDKNGKELDEDLSPRFILLTSGLYQEIIDLYLDEDEWGDMTDPDNGYDLKISRSGKGKTDTEYTVNPCKPTSVPRKFKKKVYDIEAEVRKIIPSYEETEKYINKFLGLDAEEEEEEESNPKRSSRTSGGTKRVIKKKVVKKKRTDAD